MQENLIDYFSYSSMSKLLSNQLAFKKKYVLKVYDDKMSQSGVVGQAGHSALEAFYNGKAQEEAVQAGYDYIAGKSDMEINYGSTGSREKILKEYSQAIQFYFQELPEFHSIIGVEEKILEEIKTIDGEKLGLPAKGFIDVLHRNKLGELEITDHKFVRSYTNGDVDDFPKYLQAMFNYHLVLAKYGEAPVRMTFNECKISKNRDNTPQIQPYVIDFKDGTYYGDFATFYKLYNACTAYLQNPDAIFLPNPNDYFDGQNSFEIFKLGIVDTDRPVSVRHKEEQKRFVEKAFVASSYNEAGSKSLTSEERIRLKLNEFAMPVKMEETHVGPSVTQYTLTPSKGIKMSSIANMSNDIALALGAESVRIQAPIFGTNLVGVEASNKVRTIVHLDKAHIKPGTMEIPVGVDVFNKPVHEDLADMPHLLIAGATGSGKSVMLNVLLTALTEQLTPQQLELILIDPKRVEMAQFAELPHLAKPVVYDALQAVQALDEVVAEMESRYKRLAKAKVRSIDELNAKSKSPLTKMVVVVDEFADLMMSDIQPSVESMDVKAFKENLELAVFAPGTSGRLTQKAVKEALKTTLDKDTPPSAEESIIRLAQKARAVGIHLVIATQRPSADVVTGLIKANFPTKIAFTTTSAVNSKIILDQTGAETLTGKGDMLFMHPKHKDVKRLQGFYV